MENYLKRLRPNSPDSYAHSPRSKIQRKDRNRRWNGLPSHPDTAQPDLVCHPCQNMLEGTLGDRRPQTCCIDDPSLLKACALRCPMCRILWHALRSSDDLLLNQIMKYKDDSFNHISMYHDDGVSDVDQYIAEGTPKVSCDASLSLRNQEGEAHSTLHLDFRVSYRTKQARSTSSYTRLTEDLIVYTNHEQKNIRDHCIPLDYRMEGESKLALIDSWLKQDTSRRVASSASYAPARLLEICHTGNIKLIDAACLSSPVQYVALSHRWGASQHFTTTKDTMLSRQQYFPDSSLPSTFKDAVTVTRRLGFMYLWIDALCIVQDDKEDWRLESQKMGDIFKDAVLVIAAHCARNDSEGFLSRALSKRSAFEVNVGNDTKVHFWIAKCANLETDVTKSALCKRGWVLQERFLATRTVHFTDGQIYFETTDTVESEKSHLSPSARSAIFSSENIQSRFFGPSAAPRLRQIFGLGPTATEEESVKPSLATPLEWFDLVEMYSNCDLTREEDKLMAISGLARKIQAYTRHHWYAGLWADRICEGLLWLKETTPLSRPSCMRAPSWSWAAFDGPIQHPKIVQYSSFTSHIETVSIGALKNDEKLKGHDDGPHWLNGPATLRIRARIVKIMDGCLSTETELGPGPPRSGPLTENNFDLPRLDLRQFVHVYAINRWEFETRHPLGWIAIDEESSNIYDNLDFRRPQIRVFDKSPWPPGFCFAVIGSWAVPYTHRTVYLGIYLVATNPQETIYRRVGFGQVSYSFLSGEELRWEPSDMLSAPDLLSKHMYREILII